ncbi:MAG: MotA/TolQ/ExbB proton channel family protein [Myxococcota bacterium]|jgi:biopolymer transport protein ExbB|nr:MotA/TolQ/ExbB proton channel family protein [Myxococcota bacterium]
MSGATAGLVGRLAQVITVLGAEWVLWLLLFLSVVSVAVMLERWYYYTRRKIDGDALARSLAEALGERNLEQARKLVEGSRAMEARVVQDGLKAIEQGPRIAEEVMGRAMTRERREYERKLWFLGTMGNNAPFIGLFGTVLGIIKAFADLSANVRGGAEVVMAGISEALVATAVGLLVALPAVVAYNLCKKTVKQTVSNAEVLSKTILVHVKDDCTGKAS